MYTKDESTDEGFSLLQQRDRPIDGADSPPPSSGYSDLPSGGGYLESKCLYMPHVIVRL